MERLSEWYGDKAIPRMDLRNNGNDKCLRRFAEYEDTGFTPEQINDVDEFYLEKCKEVNRLNTELEELKQQYTQFPAAVLKGEKHV